MSTGVLNQSPGTPGGQISAEALLQRMLVIREAEETLLRLFSEGKLSGTTHTSIGQEAVAVALCAGLREGDVLFSTHRCHGHYLAFGGSPVQLFAEVMGRDSELCGGRGGSQYLHTGNFFSSGVQGGVAGNATGLALGKSMLPEDRGVTVAILGDGTLGEGLVYESLNFAALRSLPVLYLVEHNGYSQSTPTELQLAGTVVARAAAFGLVAEEVRGDDPAELQPVIAAHLDAIRARPHPRLLVVHTYRLGPHSKGEDERDWAELDQLRSRDPLPRLCSALGEPRASQLRTQAAHEVASALAQAEQVPFPSLEAAAALIPGGEHPVPWPAQAPEMGVRSLTRALHRLLAEDPQAFVIGQDLLDPYGGAFKVTRGLSTAYPDRVLTSPVSEAGIVAWSVGAALAGWRPVAEIMFGDFLPLAADQLVNHAAKFGWVFGDDVQIPLVVRTPMGGGRGYGPTHSQSLESMFLGVPGLAVVAPSPLLDPGELLLRAAELADPVLFIEHKLLYAQPLMASPEGRWHQYFVRADHGYFPTVSVSLTEFEDPDVLLVAYGGQVPAVLEAMLALLIDHEVQAELLVPHVLSPAPADALVRRAAAARAVVVVEEGPAAAGFGAEVAALISEAGSARRVLRVSGPDSPLPASRGLEAQLLPSPERIVQAGLAAHA